MRVWLVVLLLAMVTIVLVSAGRRGEGEENGRSRQHGRVQAGARTMRSHGRGRQGRPGQRRPGSGGEESEGGEGEEAGEVEGMGSRRQGQGKKKQVRPVRPVRGQVNKKRGRKPSPSFFAGSPALKKCSWCVLKCKKANHLPFSQCLSTNQTSPCYNMCVRASENMFDCLTCIGDCSGTVNAETGKKENAWTCVKKPDAPCKERCAIPTPAPTTEVTDEDEREEEEEGATPPAPAQHWYSWFI